MAAGEVDMAVNMYKANKMWLPMLKLVQQHRREQLAQMHLLVAHVSGCVSIAMLSLPVSGANIFYDSSWYSYSHITRRRL